MYLVSEPSRAILPAAVHRETPAIEDLEAVHGYLHARLGNRADAEDLTQEVVLKALPRLNPDAPPAAARAYLFACARSVLANFWTGKLRIRESELPDSLWDDGAAEATEPAPGTADLVERILGTLSPEQRRILELRFLRGYSLAEVASEMGKTVGSVKVMQLRALRRAAASGPQPPTRRRLA